MNIKTIIRRYKIDNLLGQKTITTKEEELLSYLNDIFSDLYSDEYVSKKGRKIYLYFSKTKQLWVDDYIEDVLHREFKIEYVDTKNLIKDFFNYKFDVNVKSIF